MPSSGYTSITFVANEQPTTAKWNLVGSNDASFNNGNGFNDGVIVTRHLASGIQVRPSEQNPYKFSVYLNNNFTVANSGAGNVPFDTKNFDTGSNVDVVTNKGRFTAPVAGFYWISTSLLFHATAGGTVYAQLFKNGTTSVKRFNQSYTNAADVGVAGATLVQLAANDYIEIKGFNATTASSYFYAPVSGEQLCYFEGFLVSAT